LYGQKRIIFQQTDSHHDQSDIKQLYGVSSACIYAHTAPGVIRCVCVCFWRS